MVLERLVEEDLSLWGLKERGLWVYGTVTGAG